MIKNYNNNYVIFAVILTLELLLVLFLNNGQFTFVLDDPYIHLALAENIINGHYGINQNEFSAPSSSIIWPFLIAPLTLFPKVPELLFIVNIIFALVCIKYINKILNEFIYVNGPVNSKQSTLTFVLLLLIGNLIGIVFVGMEHTLQVMLACMILYYVLSHEVKERKPTLKFWALVVLCPLVRYETISIVAPLLLLYFYRGYYKETILTGLVITIAVVMFSAFLLVNDYNFLPNSILIKSKASLVAPDFLFPFQRFVSNIMTLFGWPLLLLSIFLIRIFLKRNEALALVFGSAGLVHLMFGQVWGSGRYDTYLLLSMSLLLLYYMRDSLSATKGFRFFKFISIPSILLLLTIPISAHMIYALPYKTAAMVKDHYKKPVATHDIGLISFDNDSYAFDYWGLAAKETFDIKASDGLTAEWMAEVAKSKGVELVWLTAFWPYQVPEEWTPVAELNRKGFLLLGLERTKTDFTFYATNKEAIPDIVKALKKAELEIPESVEFNFLLEMNR